MGGNVKPSILYELFNLTAYDFFLSDPLCLLEDMKGTFVNSISEVEDSKNSPISPTPMRR